MTLCLRTYNISVREGTPSVQTISEEFGSWEKTSFNETIWRPASHNSTSMTSSGSSFEYKGRGWITNLGFMNGTNTVRWFFMEKNSTWRPENVKFGDPPSDAIQHIIETGLEPVTRNLAASMTKLARDESNKSVVGTVFVSEAYVSVAWIWLAVPALVLALSILFLALTILVSLKEDYHGRGLLWKTSALPILYHGLEEEDSREPCDCTQKSDKKSGESLLTLSQMETVAGETSVRLENSRSRGKLMLR